MSLEADVKIACAVFFVIITLKIDLLKLVIKNPLLKVDNCTLNIIFI
jgi:hypothetical protein